MYVGPAAVLKSNLEEKVGIEAPGVVVFRNTQIDAPDCWLTIISSLPSPLISSKNVT